MATMNLLQERTKIKDFKCISELRVEIEMLHCALKVVREGLRLRLKPAGGETANEESKVELSIPEVNNFIEILFDCDEHLEEIVEFYLKTKTNLNPPVCGEGQYTVAELMASARQNIKVTNLPETLPEFADEVAEFLESALDIALNGFDYNRNMACNLAVAIRYIALAKVIVDTKRSLTK